MLFDFSTIIRIEINHFLVLRPIWAYIIDFITDLLFDIYYWSERRKWLTSLLSIDCWKKKLIENMKQVIRACYPLWELWAIKKKLWAPMWSDNFREEPQTQKNYLNVSLKTTA